MSQSKLLNRLGVHALGWAGYVVYYTSALFAQNTNADFSAETLIGLSIYFLDVILLFYTCYHFVFPRLFSRRVGQGILFYMCMVTLFLILDYHRIALTNLFVRVSAIEWQYSGAQTLPNFILSTSYDVVQVTSISLAFWYFQYSLRLQKQSAYAERQQLLAEVNFLKTQIDQHFLYNTLNMLYSKASLYSTDLANAIMSLSTLLRSVVTTEYKTMIPLLQELDSVSLFISLNQLRFNNRLLIDNQIEGDPEKACLPPLSLLTLVENALKHGDLKREPLVIRIQINQHLSISLRNRKHTARMHESSKIGLANIRKRFHLLFGQEYNLVTHEDDTHFSVSLTLFNIEKHADLRHC